MIQAVTIDFHDTLFICDDWFELEVKDLPARYLAWQCERDGTVLPEDLYGAVTTEYRRLRRSVIENGIELEAVENVHQVCDALGIAIDRDVVSRGVDQLMRETLYSTRPRDGAVELVHTLKSAGMSLGVVSNAIYQPFLEWALTAFEMNDAFDLVLTSARAGYYKSRPEIYLQAAEKLGSAPEATIHIGDSQRFDVAGAARAGMHTVWLDLSHEAAADCQPDLTVRSLDGLASILFETFHITPNGRTGISHAV